MSYISLLLYDVFVYATLIVVATFLAIELIGLFLYRKHRDKPISGKSKLSFLVRNYEDLVFLIGTTSMVMLWISIWLYITLLYSFQLSPCSLIGRLGTLDNVLLIANIFTSAIITVYLDYIS